MKLNYWIIYFEVSDIFLNHFQVDCNFLITFRAPGAQSDDLSSLPLKQNCARDVYVTNVHASPVNRETCSSGAN